MDTAVALAPTKVDCYGNRKDHRFCASQEPRISVDQRAITHTPATLDISHNVMIVPNEPTTEAPLAASAASSAPIVLSVETPEPAVPTTIQVETKHRNGDTDHFYQHSHIRGNNNPKLGRPFQEQDLMAS